jgi:EAL domain-containing protein (putative c-di-GMP-specific phosphodiesterase class I)
LNRVSIERDLRTAINSGQLRLHFQPLVDLGTGMIGQVEALVRWEHPDRGLVAPDQFIPVAEQTGLIVPLGRWVLFEACRQLQDWDSMGVGGGSLIMSVNLSPRQLRDPRLATDIAQVLLATGVDPHRIQLEVTETMAVENDDTTMVAIKTLRSMGLRIAIDDFGAGYSAFAYLRRCQVDSLKLDRSYVSSLLGDEGDDRIVKAVIAFTQALGIETVGEGIETSEQAIRLREMGCDVGQGYLFSRPLPAEQLIDVLRARSTTSAIVEDTRIAAVA